jgi:tetratricopeptide (TPR) repeat protein
MKDMRIKIFVGAVVVLGVGAIALARFLPNSKPLVTTPTTIDFTTTDGLMLKAEVALTPSQREQAEKNLNKYKGMVAAGKVNGEPDSMRVYLSLGQTYELLGELDLARNAYLQASKENAKLPQPFINLGTLFQRMGSDQLALQALRHAITLDATTAITWDKLIDVERKLGMGEAGIRKLFQQAFASAGNDDNLHRKYALYLEQIGKPVDALTEWEFVLRANPNDSSVQAEVTRLKRLP